MVNLLLLSFFLLEAAARSNGVQSFFEHSNTQIHPWIFDLQSDGAISTTSLSEISTFEYMTLTHPAFKDHRIRIKETKNFCDNTVKVYTGFIDFAHERKHLFFWFYESRNDPANDPVTMWINGGPGGSSAIGMLAELGPCSVDEKSSNGTIWNPHSWNQYSNLLFLDQPFGVVYSRGDHLPYLSSTPEAAKDVYAFLSIFFESLPQFNNRPFHLAGESFGGRSIPVYASAIHDYNRQAIKKHGRAPINLKSIMIGNGWTNPARLMGAYHDMFCKNAIVEPFLDIPVCTEIKYAAKECETRMEESCQRRYNKLDCHGVSLFCAEQLIEQVVKTKRNWWDITKSCEEAEGYGLTCYKEPGLVEQFLQSNKTKDVLDIPHDYHFQIFAEDLQAKFVDSGDFLQSSDGYIEGLLERGVRVLVYVGVNDLAGNYVGNYRTVQELDWSGHDQFYSKNLQDWIVEGEVAGQTKSHKTLTWATVYGAGHMVPYDRPVQAAAMFKRWIRNETL